MTHPEEHIARVMMMANEDPKWDLSPRDAEAIRHVLGRMRAAEDSLKTLAKRPGCGVGKPDCVCCISARNCANYSLPKELQR